MGVRLIDLEAGFAPWPDALWSLPADARGDAFAHRAGEWFRQSLIPVIGRESAAEPFRSGGVYILIGGAGGLGEVLSKHLIERWRARVIWVGRRARDADIERRLRALQEIGPAPIYIRADATRAGELERVRDTVKRQFGAIHGVVHSALGGYDCSLAEMGEEQFRSVLATKVDCACASRKHSAASRWTPCCSSLRSPPSARRAA